MTSTSQHQTLYRRRRTLTAARIIAEIASAIETSRRDEARLNREAQWLQWELWLKEWVRGLVHVARKAEPGADCWCA